MTPTSPAAPAAHDTAALEELFTRHFATAPTHVDPLPLSGSDRRYYRLSSGKASAIGTVNDAVAENNSFFYFTELFRKHKVAVPEVYGIAKGRKHYLQQDLGGHSLFEELQAAGHTAAVRGQYHAALEGLARIQWLAGRDADFTLCYGAQAFDEKQIGADLLYFKYYFADLQRLPYNRALLSDEMDRIARDLGRAQPQTLMYRDFQSRNVMLHDGKVWFIDFQGAMQGPPQYDLASMLWQAKAALPDDWKEDLFNGYFSSLKTLKVPRVDEVHFRRGYVQMVLLRLVQVLGAYGFRGLLERKPHFVSSIGPALKNLARFLDVNPGVPAYPELRGLLERLSSGEMQARYADGSIGAIANDAKPTAGKASKELAATETSGEDSRLTVHIQSFSYKKQGYPKDETDHGGGFVFDCRGLLNPGRYEEYKCLSGQDESVKQFLTAETRMPQFLEHVFALVSLNVDDYLARGFEHLSVSFGCTGGQHRSVYASERTADFLREKYGLHVELRHLNEEGWLRADGYALADTKKPARGKGSKSSTKEPE